MTETRPADQARRDAALDPAFSFIVRAPAGSGKTTLLVQRFLGLLAGVEEPERVLAITFTRKAAAEMRRRVADALGLARAGLSAAARAELPPDRRLTVELAKRVFERDQARAPERRWELDRYPARLRVMTFDALCLELARRMPVLSQFGAAPEPTEEDEPLVTEAALRTLDCLFQADHPVRGAVETLLDYLDNDWHKAQRLLAEMLRRRGQWRLDFERPPAAPELERALDYSIEHFLGRLADRFPEERAAELAALADYAAGNLSEAGSNSPIAALAGREELPRADQVPAWRGLAELLLRADGHWRKTVRQSEGFPGGKAGKEMKQRMEDLLAVLAEDERLRDLLRTVRTIPEGFEARQAEILHALHAVLVQALAEMRVVVGERGQADFSEIALRAEEALGRADAPSDLLLKLDYALDHLLVDEFQDTSWSQYRLLGRLTAGWQPGDGRTLFLVGDPMQSIYRFRDAEVGLFIHVWERQRLGSVGLTPLELSVNFRSSSALVDWFNRYFRRVLPRRSDAAVGAVAYTEAHARPDAGAADVSVVHCLPAATVEHEARQVAALVAELRAEHPDESVAVLVRSRRHLEQILSSLHTVLEAPFAGQKLEKLYESPTVCDLMALTRALLHPADRVAWLAVLRAPWCGLSREALLALAEHAGEGCIADALAAPPAFPDPVDERLLARAAPALAEALARRHDRSLRNWVETTWLRLGGADACRDELALAAARAFLDELERLDEAGDLADPSALEHALRERYVPPDPSADERVQVMTMHQAKGLQFDHVILPGLDRFSRGDEDPLQVWHELPGADETARTLAAVMDPPETPPKTPSVYRFVRALEKERHDYELARLLYVACTRAKRSLHLSAVVERDERAGGVRPPDSRSLLKRLWPVTAAAFAQPPPAPAPEDDLSAPPQPMLCRLRADWTPPEPPPDVSGVYDIPTPAAESLPIEYEWVSEPGRIAGVVVHEYLRRIAVEGLARWDAKRIAASADGIARRLKQHGLAEDKLTEMIERVQRALTAAVAREPGRWILAERESARNENAVSYMRGGRLRTAILDRTFIDDGVRWIVDYKASERRGDVDAFLEQEKQRYRAQLEGYAEVMRKLEGEAQPIRVALYYPLLGALVDWEPAADR